KRRFADGGLVTPNSPVINVQGLDASISKFVAASTILSQRLNNFPSEITGSFTVKHEHIFNVLGILQDLMPAFQKEAIRQIDEKLQKFVDRYLSDVGRV